MDLVVNHGAVLECDMHQVAATGDGHSTPTQGHASHSRARHGGVEAAVHKHHVSKQGRVAAGMHIPNNVDSASTSQGDVAPPNGIHVVEVQERCTTCYSHPGHGQRGVGGQQSGLGVAVHPGQARTRTHQSQVPGYVASAAGRAKQPLRKDQGQGCGHGHPRGRRKCKRDAGARHGRHATAKHILPVSH